MTTIKNRDTLYTLDNGLSVILQNRPAQTITAKLRVNYGSSHEQEGEEGIAHFLEHCLVTGGSSKYTPARADEIRCSFGYTNAYTGIDRTFFIGQMLKGDLEKWLEYTVDHVFRPRFDEERINGERERVLREISDKKSRPMYPVNIEFNNLFYRGHPKGRFNLGNEEVVRNTNQGKLKDFHRRGYHPNNVDLIIVGGLPKDIRKLIRQYFGSLSAGENTRKRFPLLPPLPDTRVIHRPAPERINTDNPEESSAHIFLSFLGPVLGHEDECAVDVMSKVLGGDTSSLLFQNLGLKKGLAYHAKVSTDGQHNAGEIGIDTEVPAKRIDEAVEAIFEEIKKICDGNIEGKTIERVKHAVQYHFAKLPDSNDGGLSAIEYVLDGGLPIESIVKKYGEVTSKSVREVANKYLFDRNDVKYVLCIRNPLRK